MLELDFTTCTASNVIKGVKDCLPMIDRNHRLWEMTSREEADTVGEMTEPGGGGMVTVPIKRNHVNVRAHHLASGAVLHLNVATDTKKWSAHLEPIQDVHYASGDRAKTPSVGDFHHVWSPEGITVRALVKALVKYETQIHEAMKEVN